MIFSISRYGHINRLVISLSQNLLLRKFFISLYKIQLKLIVVVFKRQKGISAIILRRKGVLEDLYPGDSDYDITCVIDAEDNDIEKIILGCAKRHRFLKIACPALGETKFIRRKDFANHLKYNFIGYCASPQTLGFLYKSDTFVLTLPNTYILISVYQAISWILVSRILPELMLKNNVIANQKTIFSRPIYKTSCKIDWLVKVAKSGNFSQLNYNDYSVFRKENFMRFPAERRVILKEVLNMIEENIFINRGGQRFYFTVEGKGTFPSRFLDNMHYILQPILFKYGRVLEEISLCNYGLYNSKLVLLKYRGDVTMKDMHTLCDAVEECSDRMKPYSMFFAFNHPVLLSGPLWDYLTIIEPVIKILYEHKHYDFLKKETVGVSDNHAYIDGEYLNTEIVNSLDMIYSVVRSENTTDLLNLLFGNLICYNLLLTKGVLYLSFEKLYECYLNKLNLNQSQQDIINIYREMDNVEIRKLKTISVWRIFKDLISQEADAARTLLNSGTPLHQNFKESSIT